MNFADAASSAVALKAGSDEFGVFVQLNLDPKIFSDAAIFKTAYWFTDQYYVFFGRDEKGRGLIVELRLQQGGDPQLLRRACGDFANKLLDNQVRQQVLAETRAVRDVLIKKAFFEARAAIPAEAASDESKFCAPGAKALP